MTIAVGFGSETFEFKSKYPKLHIPAYPLSSAALVTPGGASELLDGEFLVLDTNMKLARPAGNATGLGGVAGSVANHTAHVTRGGRGRSDRQYGVSPYVMDDDFEFITRLHTGNLAVPETFSAGDLMHLVINAPVINGTTYSGRVILRSHQAQGTTGSYVARCIIAPDASGWARFMAKKGFFA